MIKIYFIFLLTLGANEVTMHTFTLLNLGLLSSTVPLRQKEFLHTLEILQLWT